MFDLFESHNLIINDDYDKYPYKHIIIKIYYVNIIHIPHD